MKIENRISTFLKNIPVIRKKNGEVLTSKQFLLEYKALKNYCLNTFQDDSIVAIQFDKDYRYIMSILACMEIGLTYVPLHIEFPNERVKQIKSIASFDEIINDELFDVIITSQSETNRASSFTLNSDKILYIMFTSGSTGEPKGVEIKRESYQNFLMWIDDYFDINKGDVVLNTTEFTFDVSLVDVGLLIVKQTEIVFSNFNNNIFRLFSELEKYKITTIATVPNNFSMMLVNELMSRVDLSNLKYALIAGSRFPFNLYEKFGLYLPNTQVYNCYGPTEFTIYCIVKKLNKIYDICRGIVSVGSPILNTKFKIVDDKLNCVTNSTEGELVIGGIQLMQGYKNRPDQTHEAIVEIDGFMYYKTGDIAFSDENNNCYITGRKDDTVKISGFRVNLSDIDAYIHKLACVKDSQTIYVDIDDTPSYLVSFIILDTEVLKTEITRDLKEILPNFQMPKYIEIIKEFPLNNSGKICKKTLLEKFKYNKYSAPTN